MDDVTPTISITDMHGVQRESTGRFDAVITICQDSVEDNVGSDYYHHFPLADGPPPADAFNPGEFNYNLFYTAVETIIDHAEQNRQTLVHCHAGQSRSAMAIVAALTHLQSSAFDEAFTTVSNARSSGISPSRELRTFAERYADTTQK